MSVEFSDSDHMNGWTMVDSDGDSEDTHSGDFPTNEGALAEIENVQVTEQVPLDQEDDTEDAASQHLATDGSLLENKICDVVPDEAASVSVDPFRPMCSCGHSTSSRGGSESSEIELIPDDGATNDESVYSQDSAYSLMNDSICHRDTDVESRSSGSSISVLAECDDIHSDLSSLSLSKAELPIDLTVTRVRSYTHTPNPRLNVALNFLLVLSVTLCFGLGIGHFVGWSSRWIHQQHIHKTHIGNLKLLQGELLQCLQNPELLYVTLDGQSKPCYEKVDYWQSRFDDFLSENRVLQDFVDKSGSGSGNDEDMCEDSNPAMVADYRQLNFHLIKQQLTNLATLKHVEVLKRQEQEALDRVRLLEAEREKLRAKVMLEQADDEVDEQVIRQLTEENRELKREVVELRVAVETDVEDEDLSTLDELSTLYQKIEQLIAENEELRKVVARLHHSGPSQQLDQSTDAATNPEDSHQSSPPTSTKNTCDQIPPALTKESATSPTVEQASSGSSPATETLYNDDSNLLDSVLTSWILNSVNELNLTGFLEYLTKVATDKPTVQREIKQLRDNLLTSYDQLSKQARAGFDSGRRIASRVQELLLSKWREAMEVAGHADARMPTEAIKVIHDAVKVTLDKIYSVGAGMLEQEKAEGGSSAAGKLQKQVDKLVASLEKRWDSIYDRVWGSKLGGDGSDKDNRLSRDKSNDEATKKEGSKSSSKSSDGDRGKKSEVKGSKKSEKKIKDGDRSDQGKAIQRDMKCKDKDGGKSKRQDNDRADKGKDSVDAVKAKAKHSDKSFKDQNKDSDNDNNDVDDNKGKSRWQAIESKNIDGKKSSKEKRPALVMIDDNDSSCKGTDRGNTMRGKDKDGEKSDKENKKSKGKDSERGAKGKEKDSQKSAKDKSKSKAKKNMITDDLISAARTGSDVQKKAMKKRERQKKFFKHATKLYESIKKLHGHNTMVNSQDDSLLVVKVEETEFVSRKEDKMKYRETARERFTVENSDTGIDEASCPTSGESENASLMLEIDEDYKMMSSVLLESDDSDDDSDDTLKTDDSNKAKVLTNSENSTAENSGDWLFRRANERKMLRHSKRRSDWIFDRASDRHQARKEAEKAEWYFDRARRRYERRVGSKEAKRQEDGPKDSPKRKRQQQRTDEESDSDDDDRKWSKYEARQQHRSRHTHQQTFDWAVPDLRNYYYSS